MKLNVMFVIAAIFLTLIGIASILVPVVAPAALVGAGVLDATGAFNVMLGGVGQLSLGVIAWLVRNAEASKTRDSVVVGYTFLFALWAVISLYGVTLTEMPSHSISWLPALIQGLLAVGFFVAGRSSMSKSAG
jgi:hypothetical protein